LKVGKVGARIRALSTVGRPALGKSYQSSVAREHVGSPCTGDVLKLQRTIVAQDEFQHARRRQRQFLNAPADGVRYGARDRRADVQDRLLIRFRKSKPCKP
jgi:hypothetical protein